MPEFRFYIPIEVRYSDLDPQWHVNNARFFTYLEQARFQYLIKAGLWDGKDFFKVGLIVADVHLAYLAPIELSQAVRVGTCVTRIGNKSMVFAYVIEEASSGAALATGETVMVAYDYHTRTSMRVSDDWRAKIAAFEGHPF